MDAQHYGLGGRRACFPPGRLKQLMVSTSFHEEYRDDNIANLCRGIHDWEACFPPARIAGIGSAVRLKRLFSISPPLLITS